MMQNFIILKNDAPGLRIKHKSRRIMINILEKQKIWGFGSIIVAGLQSFWHVSDRYYNFSIPKLVFFFKNAPQNLFSTMYFLKSNKQTQKRSYFFVELPYSSLFKENEPRIFLSSSQLVPNGIPGISENKGTRKMIYCTCLA